MGWNVGQFAGVFERGSGGAGAMYNLTDIPSATQWAMYGSYNAQ